MSPERLSDCGLQISGAQRVIFVLLLYVRSKKCCMFNISNTVQNVCAGVASRRTVGSVSRTESSPDRSFHGMAVGVSEFKLSRVNNGL